MTEKRPEIRLVCFDLGGVLIRIARSWRDVLDRAGIGQAAVTASQQDWKDHQHVLQQFETGRIDQDQYFEQAACFFDGISIDQFIAAFDAWHDGLFPEVDNLLSRLASGPAQTACLSNTNSRHWDCCLGDDPRYGHLQMLDHQFASHLIGQMKPAAVVYEHVEQNTGIDPSSIVFFDDLPQNIEAAQSRGWHAHQIDPLNHPVSQMTEHLTYLGLW